MKIIIFLSLLISAQCSPLIKNDADVVCPDSEEDVFVPHPTECGLYYQCVGNNPVLMSCPDGLFFDPSLNICNWPDLVDCVNCADGYSDFSGLCYKFVDEKVSVYAATSACNNDGAVLASVHDEATNNFLASFTSDRIWLGGFSSTPRDTDSWCWADGSEWNYDNWSRFQPDFGHETFLETNFDQFGGGLGRWNNVVGLWRKNAFVCQKSAEE